MADLSIGSDATGFERFGACEYNDIKNHWRMANPRDTLTDEQSGIIVSDSDDDKLYHYQTAAWFEIIQGDTAITDDVAILFGDTPVTGDASIRYDETTNDAIIFGIPVATKRGVIICDMADIAVDFGAALITASAYPVFWFVDLDNDSYLGVGHQADDRPGIWSGPDDARILAIQYEANADITIFENSEVGENCLVYIYGWDAGAAATRYGTQQITNSGSYELNAEEQGALAQGGTVVIRWFSDRVQWLDDKLAEFGSGNDASIEYCDTLNDAWIFGIPCDGAKRGLIFCDNPAADMTFLPFRTLPTLTGPDQDLDSYWELGWFADDVGLFTVPANPLREQMLYNADFGVWSLSGLASKTTGAQSDYEIGAAIYNEDAEGADDSGNWIKTDCNMALTNDPGNGAGGSNNYYTITETNPTQMITRVLAGLTVGRIYKCSIFINNGTGTWANAELRIMNNALATTIESTALATAVGWADYSVIFEATEVNNQIVILLALGGGLTAKLDDIRVIEVGPGCFGADDYGPDTWTKTNTLDLLKVQNDATHCRGLYGIEVTKGANGAEYLNAFGLIYDKEAHYKLYRNRTVSLGCWVYSVTATDNVKLQLNDSDGTTESTAHCGAGILTWMEITRTCGATITSFTPRILFDGDTADVAYVSQPMLVFGASIGEGNYRPRQQEIVWVEKYIPSNSLEALTNQGDSGVYITVNLEADSDAKLPKGAKAVQIYGKVSDSGSLGTIWDAVLALRADAVRDENFFISCAGLANNAQALQTAFCPLDVNGDYQYQIYASGGNTFDLLYLHYLGIQIN